ncbi:MAG TPA: DNA translocase FtsK 4TM domain-containing protein [Chloroflexota bacterium]|nr:DNA translocase FtsK 4TM domain-containing protein [Chloroflexota bacterium]
MSLGTAARPTRAQHHSATRWPLIRDGLAVLAVALGCFFGVVVFLPAEGRIAAPLHELLGLLFGRASFVLPIGLVIGGGLALVRSFLPEVPLAESRLAGLVVITLAALPAEHLIGLGPNGSLARAEAHEGAGLVGHWTGSLLLEWLGGPATAVVLIAALLIGTLLAFDLTLAQLVAAVVRGARWTNERFGVPRRPRLPDPRLGFRVSPWVFAVRGQAPPPVASEPPGLAPDEWQRPLTELADAPTPNTTEPAAAIETSVAQEGAAPAFDFAAGPDDWRLPSFDLFHAHAAADVSQIDLDARARVIEDTLASFNIEARVVEVNQGPAVTQFGVEPAAGVAVSRILSRQNDLALRLGSSPLRLEAPVPGKNMVGVEVPNAAVATVTFRDVLSSDEWARQSGRLRLALGRDVSGKAIVSDLARMPHLLIAGATGAGKSVCINTIVGSLLCQFTPDELQLLMVDPKRVELVGFGGVPHLRLPVVTEMERVVVALKWVVLEMDRRYKLFAQRAVRNLEGYNRWAASAQNPDERPLPYLVVVIDELADMMMTAADEVERTLCRLAQLARATGIHLVVATQRPSVDVLTGLIKANFPTRIAFAVSSQTDSRVILDQAGAEKLLGRGDALFMPPDAMKPIRLQGAFVSDDEMLDLVGHWKAQGGPRYTEAELEQIAALGRPEDEDDDVYDKACDLAETVGRLSASLLQRRLGIGHARAQRLLDRLIEEGLAEE